MSTANSAAATPIEDLDLGDLAYWQDGPPHALFERLRKESPVHWSPMAGWPDEPGFWSVATADLIHEVSRDWETFSSERGGILILDHGVPLEVQQAMFIGMDPPRHDRIKAIFQRGFTPKRIADHEEEVLAIVTRVLDRIADRDTVDLVEDVAQPVVSRVIGSFLGIAEEDDAMWAAIANQGLAIGDKELQPDGRETVDAIVEKGLTEFMAFAAERRANPTDDLTSLLLTAEIDGERLEEHEVAFGFALLNAAGNDSTKATYSNGMLALLRDGAQREQLIADPSLVPGAVEEFLRMFPAFAHFRRTATRDVELGGQQIHEGDKVILWYPSSNRDEQVYGCPHQMDVKRNPDHQAFGAGGRHFCLGTALARLELRILFAETLRRFPEIELIEEPEMVCSFFVNQPRSVPVRLRPSAAGTLTQSAAQ